MLNTLRTKSQGAFERGNASIYAILAVLVVALGAGAYFSGILGGSDETSAASIESAAGEAQAAEPEKKDEAKAEDAAKDKSADATKPEDIKEGNPTVAKLNGKEIKRADVLKFIENLSPQARQMPIDKLFPLALEQVVNTELVNEKVTKANIESDPEVQKEMQIAKEQIVRSVYMQKEAEKAVTDDLLKTAYENYKKNFPKMEEAKARHILVKEEKKAEELIKQLEGGADFAKLAKENSIDATKEKGGELSYFTKQDVVPEFGEAVFGMSKGDVTKKPVKTEFGFHVIELLDKRQREAATLEQAKPFLTAQLRGQVLNALMEKWRDEAKLEVFDINGNPIEPSAGNEAKKEEPKK